MKAGLRLFLSYGHDEHTPLVTRISEDLEARGHQVWIDQTSMKEGQHWRRTILDGIQNSSGVIAFLSKHSTRVPGGCLDELRIAVSLPGVNIATVLMEPEEEVNPPGIIAEIQWLDLSGWRDESAEGDTSFDAWYTERFDRLCAALESPETKAFVGEITELRERLHPIVLDQKERELLDSPYVGRQWLRKALNEWRVNKPESKAFVVLGSPGAGKSAFAVRTLWDDPYAVCGILIEWDKAVTNDPRQVIRTMAFKLASRLPDYRKLLLDTLRDLRSLDDAGVAELFAWLITQPLSYCSGTDRERVYIIIDALDESPDEHLAHLLADKGKDLPSWIGVVVTARQEPDLVSLFDDFAPVVLDADNAQNTRDILQYLESELSGTEVLLPAGRLDVLATRAEGSFWWAKLMVEHMVSGGCLDSDMEPGGLGSLYRQWFQRSFSEANSWVTARGFLELMLADESISEDLMMAVAGSSLYDLARFVRSAGSLITQRTVPLTLSGSPRPAGDETRARIVDTLSFCHKSVADWLTSRPISDPFFVDRKQGARQLLAFLHQIENSNQHTSTNPVVDTDNLCHLRARAAHYYVVAEEWDKYKTALVWDDFGHLWDEVDSFPPNWDVKSIHQILHDAYRQPWDSISHGKYLNQDRWEDVFRVIRRAVRGDRLAQCLFTMLRGPEKLDVYFRTGASTEGNSPPAKERIATDLVAALKRCNDLGVSIPEDIELLAARVAVSSKFWGTVLPADSVSLPTTLGKYPEIYSYGVFDAPDAEAAQPIGGRLPQLARLFNYCAAAYEFTYAATPDENRLRRILASGVSPRGISQLVWNVKLSTPHCWMGLAHNYRNWTQTVLNGLIEAPRWHPVRPRVLHYSAADGEAEWMFDCCGLEVDAGFDTPTQERLDGCQPIPDTATQQVGQ